MTQRHSREVIGKSQGLSKHIMKILDCSIVMWRPLRTVETWVWWVSWRGQGQDLVIKAFRSRPKIEQKNLIPCTLTSYSQINLAPAGITIRTDCRMSSSIHTLLLAKNLEDKMSHPALRGQEGLTIFIRDNQCIKSSIPSLCNQVISKGESSRVISQRAKDDRIIQRERLDSTSFQTALLWSSTHKRSSREIRPGGPRTCSFADHRLKAVVRCNFLFLCHCSRSRYN